MGTYGRERVGDRGRNVVTREFNEHFFQLKSLHSVHYEAAEAAAEAAEAATAACFNGKSPPLGPPLTLPPAEKSNCGLKWNERRRREGRKKNLHFLNFFRASGEIPRSG